MKKIKNSIALSLMFLFCISSVCYSKKAKEDTMYQPYFTFDENNLSLAQGRISVYDSSKIPYRISKQNNDGSYTYEYHNCTENEFKQHVGVANKNSDESIYKNYIESQNDEGKNIGWVKIDGKTYYEDMNGEKKHGWQYIESDWYYIDIDTYVLVTGWKEINDNWYFFADDGKMAKGWKELNNSKYYFDNDGKLVTGWKEINGNWYLFNNEGKMLTGWQENNKFYLDANGVMIKNTTKNIDGVDYVFDANGSASIKQQVEENTNSGSSYVMQAREAIKTMYSGQYAPIILQYHLKCFDLVCKLQESPNTFLADALATTAESGYSFVSNLYPMSRDDINDIKYAIYSFKNYYNTAKEYK